MQDDHLLELGHQSVHAAVVGGELERADYRVDVGARQFEALLLNDTLF